MLGYIFEVIKDEISYRRERARRAALPPPTLQSAPSPAEPSLGMRILSPPTGPTSSKAPLNNWSHPFGDRGNPLQQLTQLADAQAGYYPLGRNGMWHGGVHLDGGTTDPDALSQVRCLADGEVVAYRVPENTPLSTFFPEAGGTLEAPFAAGLVLVRHRLQAPKIDGSSDDPPSLTFFSLYMHLEDWARYLTDPVLSRPSFWHENPVLRVKPDAPDSMPGHPEQRGASVRHKNYQGQVIDFLPLGTPVTISGNGDYRKLENSCGPASLRDEEGALRGYVSFSHLAPLAAGGYRVNVIRDPLIVREEPGVGSRKIGELPKDTEVTISGEGEFRKLESIAQYVSFKSLQSERKPLTFDGVVVLVQPAPIKAGELIGHLGRYQESDETAPQQKLHLEVFSNDDVQAFFTASRAWAERLPDTHKTWLKLAKGTPVAAHQDHISASLLPIWSQDNPCSDADLLVPKSLLDGLPPERKIQVSFGTSGKTYNWYRLDGLLHDKVGKPLHGWVREEVGGTPWVSPWSWEGHNVLYNYALPQLSLSYLLSVTGVLGEESKERLHERAQKWDKGRMQTRLYEIIDQDRNGKMTADELQAALRMPAKSQALAQLVIFSESEWNYRQSKWDALDEVLGHTNSAPILNWVAEKQRIKQLSWWGEVAGKVGLPKEGMVFHIHPIALIGSFYTITKSNDLIVQRGQITFDAEGNDSPNSPYFSRRLHWPGGASGVTLGRGYDMKHRSYASVYSDLIASGVGTVAASNFSHGATLSGAAARDFVAASREDFGSISKEAQRILFEDVVYPRYELAAKKKYSDKVVGNFSASRWEHLHSRIRDVVVDLTYQQGSVWDRQFPYILGNDCEELAQYILATPELSQYEAGRRRAKYLTEGKKNE